MNISILNMNHSPKMQEPDSQHLPFERDLFALYSAIVEKVGAPDANELGRSLAGKSYDEKCAAFVRMIAYIAAYEADRVRNPKYPAMWDTDPRTAAERDLDAWQADTYRTQQDARP